MAGTIGPSRRNYRSGPALVVHSEGLGRTAPWVESIDIVTNPRRAVDLRGSTPTLDPSYTLEGGVWETAVEGALISGSEQLGSERLDTWGAFDIAQRAAVEPVVLLPGQPKPPLDLSADTHAAIDRDLENGYAIIIPSAEESPDTIGWWRVQLETGETLGQLRDGRGQFSVETAVVLMIISMGMLVYSLKGCTDMTETSSDLPAGICCVVANMGMAGLITVLGFALVGAAGALATMTMDFNRTVIPTAAVCKALFSAVNGSARSQEVLHASARKDDTAESTCRAI